MAAKRTSDESESKGPIDFSKLATTSDGQKFTGLDVQQIFDVDGFPVAHISESTLRSIESLDDVMALINVGFGGVEQAAEVLGDGFDPLEDKDDLIGVPFVVVNFRLGEGEYNKTGTTDNGAPGKFLSMRVITIPKTVDDPIRKYTVIDGGTGIMKQVVGWAKRSGRGGGLMCPNGLRKSTYNHPEYGPGTTHYIDTRATEGVEEPF